MAKQSKTAPLRVPCCYQGGKQRISNELVSEIFSKVPFRDSETRFYDLCSGSGAVTIELINHGVRPEQVTMLDRSSWGVFWSSIGNATFDVSVFADHLSHIPGDKRQVKNYMTRLSSTFTEGDEQYVYPILQACSFGGKQIWHDGNHWENAFFRDYWEPTATSVRQSPANPMQPSPETLLKRVERLVERCPGLECIHDDIGVMLTRDFEPNSVVYMDPPYRNTTGYAFGFDVDAFIAKFKQRNPDIPLFVSENIPLSTDSTLLHFGGAKGGISGNKTKKHQEWLSVF